MLTLRHLNTVIVVAAVLAAGCRGGDTQDESPGEVLARDSSLAEDLKMATDTAMVSEAADISMAPSANDSLMRTTPTSGETREIPPAPPATVPTRSAPTTPTPPATVERSSAPTGTRAGSPGIASGPATATQPMPPAARIPDLSRTRPAPRNTVPVSALTAAQACAAPGLAEQRRCLMLHLSRSDAGLDRTYQSLIAELKRQAGTKPGEAEPESVRRLRQAQRAWLVYRDDECRKQNKGKEGPLWAPVRAQCLGRFSEFRAEELAQTLARVSPH